MPRNHEWLRYALPRQPAAFHFKPLLCPQLNSGKYGDKRLARNSHPNRWNKVPRYNPTSILNATEHLVSLYRSLEDIVRKPQAQVGSEIWQAITRGVMNSYLEIRRCLCLTGTSTRWKLQTREERGDHHISGSWIAPEIIAGSRAFSRL